jgi:hypothetical protein
VKPIHLDYLDEHQVKLTEALKILRGSEYLKHYHKVFAELSGVIQSDAIAIIEKQGKFTPVDIAEIALKYNLCFKPCCEFLEKLEVLRRGSYEKMKDRKNFKVRDLLAAAKERNNWT